MRVFNGFEELKAAVGRIGVSDWIEVTQDRINKFADATCDEQWIHVDQERAKAEMPGGKTIAHGLLPLSLADVHAFGEGLKGLKNTLNTARTVSATFRRCRSDQGCAAASVSPRPRTCRPTDCGSTITL